MGSSFQKKKPELNTIKRLEIFYRADNIQKATYTKLCGGPNATKLITYPNICSATHTHLMYFTNKYTVVTRSNT